MKAVTNPLDLRVTLFVLGMAISFGLTHNYSDKTSMPVLMWAAAGVLIAPFPSSMLCLPVMVGWLLLWLVAFYAGAQKGQVFFWAGLPLWLTVSALMAAHSFRRFDENLWFWLPALVFTGCSLKLVHLFYFTKYFEQST